MPYPPALSTSTSAITTAASCAALIIVRTLYTRSRPRGPPLSGLAAPPGEAGQLHDSGDGGEAVRRVRGDVVAGPGPYLDLLSTDIRRSKFLPVKGVR